MVVVGPGGHRNEQRWSVSVLTGPLATECSSKSPGWTVNMEGTKMDTLVVSIYFFTSIVYFLTDICTSEKYLRLKHAVIIKDYMILIFFEDKILWLILY